MGLTPNYEEVPKVDQCDSREVDAIESPNELVICITQDSRNRFSKRDQLQASVVSRFQHT